MRSTILQLPTFRFPSIDNVRHAMSTRHGGVSSAPYATLNLGFSTGDDEENVQTNRERFFQSLEVSDADVAVGHLKHGNDVSVFRTLASAGRTTDSHPSPGQSSRRGAVFSTDAVVSDVSSLYFLMTFADCVPLLFYDRRRRVVGLAHAGWRGTALGIGPAVVRAMERNFGTEAVDLRIGIGPSIGPCCYSVGHDVVDSFRHNGFDPAIHGSNGSLRLDLWETNVRQLRSCGVVSESIELAGICTSCNVDTYFSHRAEHGTTGRQAVCVGLD